MHSLPILFGKGGSPFATGSARYLDCHPERPSASPRIYLEVRQPLLDAPVLALVDTAAPWCIFRPAIGDILRKSLEPVSDGEISLSTRLGTFTGELFRGPLTFSTLEGEPLEVEATIFLSPDWPGDNFLGYEGFLQRIRFAVDPRLNRFYFGHLG